MLPPDTPSTLLPWRVMVPVMQLYGCFPYRVSEKSGPPTFSLALCLWSFFQQFLLILINIRCFNIIFVQHLTSDLGTAAFIIVTAISMVGFSLTPTCMGIRSSTLAALLSDMSDIKDIILPPKYRWYCKLKTLVVMISVPIASTYLGWMSCVMLGSISFFEMVVLVYVCMIWCTAYLLPEELCSMVFCLLARRLVAATEDTVSKVSMLLAPDGSYKRESDVEAAMLALRDLDAVIQEV